ncbi:MAG: ATP-binding protein [Xanthomonadales bacterium]|nr:ATP-binding protein [Xanthomonadales bacterium]
MSEEPVFDLSVNASLDKLQEIRSFIDRAGALLGVNKSAMGDLRVAVDEAVTNVVIHGYAESDGIVELHMQADADAVVIKIRDRAASFDPSQVKAPQLNTALKDRPLGGMGIFLIRKMTDEAEFLPLPGGGNEIRLVKRGVIQTNTSGSLV